MFVIIMSSMASPEFITQADVMNSEMVKVSKDNKSNIWVLSTKQVSSLRIHPDMLIGAVNTLHTQQ